jgi:hypothetical protein
MFSAVGAGRFNTLPAVLDPDSDDLLEMDGCRSGNSDMAVGLDVGRLLNLSLLNFALNSCPTGGNDKISLYMYVGDSEMGLSKSTTNIGSVRAGDFPFVGDRDSIFSLCKSTISVGDATKSSYDFFFLDGE